MILCSIQGRMLPDHVSLGVTLTRSSGAFNLLSSINNANHKVQLIKAKLWVRKSRILPSILNAHRAALRSSTYKYPLQRVQIHTYVLSAGIMQETISNLFLSQTPRMLLVAFVQNSSFTGSYTGNPYNFQHYNLNFFQVQQVSK